MKFQILLFSGSDGRFTETRTGCMVYLVWFGLKRDCHFDRDTMSLATEHNFFFGFKKNALNSGLGHWLTVKVLKVNKFKVLLTSNLRSHLRILNIDF